MQRLAFARLTILDKGESMKEYHKIQTIFKRDMENKGKTLLEGQWTLPEFEFLANNEWVFTEKVDGTNIRIMWDGEKVSFGGKTDRAAIPAKLVDRLRERFPDGFAMSKAFDCGDVCLYGEGYGAGIQNGGGYRPDQDFVLFDVKVGPWWLQRKDVEDVAVKLGLAIVPVVGSGTLHDAVEFVRHGMVSHWRVPCAEGIVARPKTELITRGGDRIITKIKCRDFA
jgi:hypothetical protein